MSKIYFKAIVIGVVAGMRTFAAPAIVGRHFSQNPSDELDDSPLGFIAGDKFQPWIKAASAGELFADKFSFIGNRTDIGPMTARAVSGAFCGAAIFTAENEQPVIGGIIGAAAALASAELCYMIRRELTTAGIPDRITATAEDAIALTAGTNALKL